MTGEKEDAVGKLRTELAYQLKVKGLSKDEKQKIRKQLVELSSESKSRQREEKKPEKQVEEITPQVRARRDALDLRDRISFITERQGAYRAAWIKYRDRDGSVVAGLMGAIGKHLEVADAIADAVLAVDKPTDDLVHQLEEAIARVNDAVLPTLQRVDALLRQEEIGSHTSVTVGDPMQVLDGLEASCDPQDWKVAVRNSKGGRLVLGSAGIIDRLADIIGRYVKTWDSLKTDGIKGASYNGLEKLATLRMEIVQTIAGSGDPLLMACCRPDTDFYNYIKTLASQSCDSRDVQNFPGWWQKRGKKL